MKAEWNDALTTPKDRPILVKLDDGQIAVMEWETEINAWYTKGWERCYYCGGSSRAELSTEDKDRKVITGWKDLWMT